MFTKNHKTILDIVRSHEGVSIDEATKRASFTRHPSRVRRILFDLHSQGLVEWKVNGDWHETKNRRAE